MIDVDHDRGAIAVGIKEQMTRGRAPSDHIYGDGRAGARIAERLATAGLTIEKRLTY